MENNIYGKNITLRRKQLGFSQVDLARHLDIARGTVANWEKGRREPPLSSLIEISNILTISLDELLETDSHLNKDPYELTLKELLKELNDEGKEKLVEYGNDLASSGRYIKNYKYQSEEEIVG